MCGTCSEARTDYKSKRRLLACVCQTRADFEDQDLIQVLEALKRTQADGVILTNTTLNREGLRSIWNNPGAVWGNSRQKPSIV